MYFDIGSPFVYLPLSLWPEFVAFYPGYEFFQSNAKGRKIPIVILEPLGPARAS